MAGRTIRTIAVAAWVTLVLTAPLAAQAESMQLNVRDVAAKEVLKLIAEAGGFNLAIGAGVKGNVTLYIEDMAPRDLLDIVIGIIDAAYVEENGAVWVMGKEQYESRYGDKFVDNLVSRTFILKHAKAKEVMPSVKGLLGDKAIVKPDLARNLIRIKASPRLVEEAARMLADIDKPTVTRGYQLDCIPAGMAAEMLGRMVTDQTIIVEDVINQRLLVSSSEFELNRIETILSMLDVGGQLETAVLQIEYSQPDSLAESLRPYLTPDVGQIHADNRSRKIIVTDYSSTVETIARLAEEFDVPARQVLIEARIIQVQTSKEVSTGINWTVLQNEMNLTGTFPALALTDPGLRGDFGDLTSSHYNIIIQALETYGTTNLLSSPRLMVANGGTGSIHVGSQVPYKTIDTRETAAGTINQFETVVIVDVGVKLEVEVTILGNGMIRMNVRPEVSAVIGFSDDVPVVESSIVDSSLIIESGNTVILGGLIKDEVRTTRKGVPILSSIPLIKYLFSSNVNEDIQGEMVILLTPRIMTGREEHVPEGEG